MGLYEYYETITLNTINEFLNNQKEEGLYLEFKRLSGVNELDKDDKKNLAKCISGFANADGGIMIWGIDTKKIKDVDCAFSDMPINELETALSLMRSAVVDATSPILNGIIMDPIYKKDSVNTGYIKIYIPPTDGEPVMARYKENRYLRRNNDGVRVMDHYEIMDMLGRRPRPELNLYYEIVPGGMSDGPNGKSIDFHIILGIKNIGKGIAKYPGLEIHINEPYKIDHYGIDGNMNFGLRMIRIFPQNPQHRKYCGGVDDVIHPGDHLQVTRVTTKRIRITPEEQQYPPALSGYCLLHAEGIAIKEKPFTIDIVTSAQVVLSLANND